MQCDAHHHGETQKSHETADCRDSLREPTLIRGVNHDNLTAVVSDPILIAPVPYLPNNLAEDTNYENRSG